MTFWNARAVGLVFAQQVVLAVHLDDPLAVGLDHVALGVLPHRARGDGHRARSTGGPASTAAAARSPGGPRVPAGACAPAATAGPRAPNRPRAPAGAATRSGARAARSSSSGVAAAGSAGHAAGPPSGPRWGSPATRSSARRRASRAGVACRRPAGAADAPGSHSAAVAVPAAPVANGSNQDRRSDVAKLHESRH